MQRTVKVLVAIVVIGMLAEGSARLTHIADVPLYNANNKIGYIPSPNQEGTFLRTRKWAFNELSMGTPRPFQPDNNGDILLVGDSIVFGGNPYRQEDRLGPQLEAITNSTVWPISAGSWALQNELEYLRENPDVVPRVHQIVLILNSDDFGEPSHWTSELTHPRSKPWLDSVYAFDRYVVGWEHRPDEQSLAVAARNNAVDFRAFVASTDKLITIVLYPSKSDLDKSKPCDFSPSWLSSGQRYTVVCVADNPDWNSGLYRDGIHPTVAGNKVLAKFIFDSIKK